MALDALEDAEKQVTRLLFHLETSRRINQMLLRDLDKWIKRCVFAEQERDLLADWKQRNLGWEDERVEMLCDLRALRAKADRAEPAAMIGPVPFFSPDDKPTSGKV